MARSLTRTHRFVRSDLRREPGLHHGAREDLRSGNTASSRSRHQGVGAAAVALASFPFTVGRPKQHLSASCSLPPDYVGRFQLQATALVLRHQFALLIPAPMQEGHDTRTGPRLLSPQFQNLGFTLSCRHETAGSGIGPRPAEIGDRGAVGCFVDRNSTIRPRVKALLTMRCPNSVMFLTVCSSKCRYAGLCVRHENQTLSLR